MKYQEPGAAESVRNLPCCWCQHAGVDAAHVFGRGAGEVTIPENLVPLCRPCHTASHYSGRPSHADLLALAAARCGVLQHEIKRAVHAIRRLPKGSDAEARAVMQSIRLRPLPADSPGGAAGLLQAPPPPGGPQHRDQGVPADEDRGWRAF